MRDVHPLRTYGTPEDIANLVNWLASDEARYASGQLWVLDGGLSAQGAADAAVSERFEDMLTGGHPNSLGRTIEVVEAVLADEARMEELFGCYGSADEVVRLRVSNAMRRVQAERPDLIVPFIDRLIEEIGALDQASAQWTLPKLFEGAEGEMSEGQKVGGFGLGEAEPGGASGLDRVEQLD